ncbi:MAG: alpha/beta hydrolase [Saprospiraceae bacterium]|nr:alpha/beta hydrolase [Saprospiraceae bacterium]
MLLRKKRLFWTLSALIGIPVIWFITVVWVTDPPIITGQVIRDVEYKPGLSLDIYTPTQLVEEKTPVVLFIHGGAWIVGTKEAINYNRFNEAINNLRDAGYTIISIDYTLGSADQSPFPACLNDAADALAWVVSEAEHRGWDVQNIGLFGESAGAQIALMLAYCGPSNFNRACPDVNVRYVLDIYGPNQLEGIFKMPTAESYYSLLAQLPTPISSRIDLSHSIFGFDPEQDSLRAQRYMDLYSPYNYCHSSTPPTLIIQGDEDHLVPVQQSISLKARLDSLGVENEMMILKGVDHGFIGASPEQKEEVQKKIESFVRRHRFEEAKK